MFNELTREILEEFDYNTERMARRIAVWRIAACCLIVLVFLAILAVVCLN